MGTKALVSAVILSMFTAGCASMKPTEFSLRPSAKGCNGSGNCFVDITLSTGSIVVDDAEGVFRCRPEQNRKVFICANAHPPNPAGLGVKVYKYTINLRGAPPVNAYDPFMVND